MTTRELVKNEIHNTIYAIAEEETKNYPATLKEEYFKYETARLDKIINNLLGLFDNLVKAGKTEEKAKKIVLNFMKITVKLSKIF